MQGLLPRCATVVAAIAIAAPAVRAQSVDEIIAKNIKAKGGAELLASTTSVRTTGQGTMQGAAVSITSSTKRPYFVRNEMELAGQKRIVGFDGSTLWMSMAGQPPQALPQGPQTESLKQSSQIDSPLVDYKAKGTKIELGDTETIEGRTLHHLVVTPKGAPTMHYYIDAATNLEAKMVIDVEDGAQKMKMEMRFADFQNVDGRTVPMTMTQIVNGKQVVELKYSKIEFNVPMDDAFFRMPK